MSRPSPFSVLETRLTKLEKMTTKNSNSPDLRKMIFTFCITSLEAYLYEIFIGNLNSDERKIKYLQNEGRLKDKKIPLPTIYKEYANIDDTIYGSIELKTFSNFDQVFPLFKGVLGISFGDVGPLNRFITRRHGFVHKFGIGKDGDEDDASVDDIKALIQEIKTLCSGIDKQLNQLGREQNEPS